MKLDYVKMASRAITISLLAATSETTGGGGSTGGYTTAAAAQGGGATAEVVAATEAWIATLDDAQREQVSFAFDDELKT